jgi:hypothetical protein
VRQIILAALVVLPTFLLPVAADAVTGRCAEMFPDIEWSDVVVDAPVTFATSGMSAEMSARYAADAERVVNLVHAELGGLEGTAMCLTVPEIGLDVGDLVPAGQRLHVAVFGEEKVFALSAVEIRMVDDAIAFGLPHIALWQLAADLGLPDGYPEPLASTVSHWYLARDNDRLERYHAELVVQLFLDDPNPDQRTAADATPWVAGVRADPFTFDPQFVASPMGDLIDHAVESAGVEVLRDPSQETWGALETEWRIAMKNELLAGRSGSWGAEAGAAIIIFFVFLAILLAWQKRRQNKRAAERRPTPPADEHLFTSRHE